MSEGKTHQNRRYVMMLVTLALIVFGLCYSCSGGKKTAPKTATAAPTQAATRRPTLRPLNTATATLSPSPTATAVPSATPRPTATRKPTATPTATPTPMGQAARVVEVVDGDTIKVEVDGEVVTVRYIGIDTPETKDPNKPVEWMGVEATEANRALVEGQTVYLVQDVSETDRYGRWLRYVYMADGTLVNAELVRQGYAQISTYPPDVAQEAVFVAAQEAARTAKVGLWQPTPMPTATPRPTATQKPAATRPPAPTNTRQPQPTAAPTATPGQQAVCDCSGDTLNCGDLKTHARAQACFDYCMSLGRGDVHRLDQDNDGIACESLP